MTLPLVAVPLLVTVIVYVLPALSRANVVFAASGVADRRLPCAP